MVSLESIWIFQIARQCAFDVLRLPKGPESRNYTLGNIMKNKMKGSNDSIGVNYLKLCDATVGKEAKDAHRVAAGIRSVIKGETKEFLYDYPRHGPDGRHFSI
jgi:hypothetical protein